MWRFLFFAFYSILVGAFALPNNEVLMDPYSVRFVSKVLMNTLDT